MIMSHLTINWQSQIIEKADDQFLAWIDDASVQGKNLSRYFRTDTGNSLKARIIQAVSDGKRAQIFLEPLFDTTKFPKVITFIDANQNRQGENLVLPLFPVGSDLTTGRSDAELISEVLTSVNDFIFVCSPDYTIQKTNPSARIVYGGGEDLLGTKCHEVLYGKNGSFEDCPLPETLLSGTVVPFEYFDENLGEYLETRTYPLTDDRNQYQGFVLFNRNITSRRKQETKTIQREKLETLSRFSSGIFHDFNNRLTIILGRVQLLRQKLHDPAVIGSLKTIEKTAMESTEIIQRIQDITRIPEEIEIADFPPVSLNTLVKDFIEEFRPMLVRKSDEQGIHIEIESTLEEISIIAGEKEALYQALYNLVMNAVEALEKGGVITIWTTQNDDVVKLGVSDTGTGISKEIQDKIFDPFFSTKAAKESGLGLAEVFSIVNYHGASIHLKSEPSKGATFIINFPPHPSEGF